MPDHNFTFGGVCSADYGAVLEDVQIWRSPVRDRTFSVVPGRNGESVSDNGRFGCVNVTYRLAILKNFKGRYDGLKNALLGLTGWQRLEDTIDPEVYRMALVNIELEPTVMSQGDTGSVDITFRCQPQRWLRLGDSTVSFSTPANSISNPFAIASLPLITVYGSGSSTLTIGQAAVEIYTLDGHIVLDCELMDAYKIVDGKKINCNSHIYAPEFPTLKPGDNAVAWAGGITRVDITPRWWKL